MKTLIGTLLAAVGSTIAMGTNKLLLTKGIEINTALFVSSIIAAVFYVVSLYLLTDLPLRLHIGRQLFDRRSKYEGYYIEIFVYLKSRPVSIGHITYNPDAKSYDYCGRAYDTDGKLAATWEALDIHIDCGHSMARHFFTGTIIGEASKIVRGYGGINFNNGEGFFIDSGSDLAEHHFNIYKLTKRDLVELTGHKQMPKKEDWYQLITAYMERKGYKNS